jgi:hypothetical protein
MRAEANRQADKAGGVKWRTRGQSMPYGFDGRLLEDEQLRSAIEAIKQATIEGRVCDDVAWFDAITTLHDFSEQTLRPYSAA